MVKNKIDYISFGARDSNYRGVDNVRDEIIIDIANKIRQDNENAIIGFCPTNCGEKYLHIDYASDLVNKAEEHGFCLYLIMVGTLKAYLNTKDCLKDKLLFNNRVIIIDEFIDYDAYKVSSHIDFYWRGLNDQSISYSLYEAATQKKPTLSLNVGFVGNAVGYYNLGAVINKDFSNIEESFKDLLNWDSKNAELFLYTHSWKNSVSKIKKVL